MTNTPINSAIGEVATGRKRRVAIIGAGLTGLSAAHRLMSLAPNVEVTLFESSARSGGLIETVRKDGFLIERGADSFITNKPAAVELCRELGLEDQLIPTNSQFRGSLVLRNGKPLPTPDGFSLLTPSRLGPIFRSPIFSWKGKLRIAAEQFVRKSNSNVEESLSTFVRRRFGNEAFERLVQPMVGGIYTADPEKLSLSATLPRFIGMERQHGSLIKATRQQKAVDSTADQHASGARYGLFATFKDGMQQFFGELQKQVCSQATIRFSTAVKSLVRTANGWDVETDTLTDTLSDSVTESFDEVIVSTATYVAGRLLQQQNSQLAELLNAIEYASTAVVCTAHRLQDVDYPCNAFGLVIPAIEQRKILAISFSSRKFPDRAPDDQILMRTFVGGATQPELLNRSDDELVDLVREETSDILGIRNRETLSIVTRYNNAMPQYHIGHQQRISAIEKLVDAEPGLHLAGSAYHGVGIPDCVRSGREAADRVLQSQTP